MENINIKVILDEVFGKSYDSITCDTCKYKEDCELINKFINDIKDKGLSPDQYVRGLDLFVYVLKEQKYINDFGKTQEDIIKLATKINNLIAQHIIDTSNAEYKEMIKMINQSVDNNKQENKFKNVSDDETYAEIKRRKANKSAK